MIQHQKLLSKSILTSNLLNNLTQPWHSIQINQPQSSPIPANQTQNDHTFPSIKPSKILKCQKSAISVFPSINFLLLLFLFSTTASWLLFKWSSRLLRCASVCYFRKHEELEYPKHCIASNLKWFLCVRINVKDDVE
jgi:hypothetical protein